MAKMKTLPKLIIIAVIAGGVVYGGDVYLTKHRADIAAQQSAQPVYTQQAPTEPAYPAPAPTYQAPPQQDATPPAQPADSGFANLLNSKKK